jgi:hypothetical protein
MIPIPAQSFAAISRKLPVHETPRGFSLICFVEDILVLCIAQRQGITRGRSPRFGGEWGRMGDGLICAIYLS